MIKFRFSKILKYFRELSIVIIGVAVTLLAGNLINSLNEDKNLQLQLNAIQLELTGNRERVEDLVNFYAEHDKLKQLLTLAITEGVEVDKDTMSLYVRNIGKIPPFTFKKGAYEMFLNSGVMKQMKDHELLIDITDSYAMLEIVKDSHNRYVEMKLQEIMKLYAGNTKYITGDIDIKHSIFQSIVNFYISLSEQGYYAKQADLLIGKVVAEQVK